MRLRDPDLQSDNNQAKKLWAVELPKGWKDVKELLQYVSLLYISEII